MGEEIAECRLPAVDFGQSAIANRKSAIGYR
jgi:hypothetical protein